MKRRIATILTITMLISLVTTVGATGTALNPLYDTQTIWFPITEETGGNAEYFLEKGAYGLNVGDNKTDFIPMVDYGSASKRYSADEAAAAGYSSGVGYYPTGADTVVSGQLGAFGYTIDAGTDNTKEQRYVDLITKDGKTYWNINGKDYAIGVNGRAIKILANVRTELITDEAIKARFESLKGVTFDVTDGYYDSVGFLVGMSSSSKRNFKYKLVYEDETTALLTSPYLQAPSGNNIASAGFLYRQKINPTQETMSQPGNTSVGGNCRYFPVTIDTDVTKKLTAIELVATTDWEVLYFISSWGEKPSIASQLEKVTDAEDLTEENYAEVQSELANFMEYVEVCGLSYADLDADMKAKVDAINNPFPQIMANIIATLDENAEITSENIYAYKDMLVEIENYKNKNSLEYTEEQIAKINKINSNINAVEYTVIVGDLNTKIIQLPETETITTDTFAEYNTLYNEIIDIMFKYNIDETDLTEENQTKLNAFNNKLEEVAMNVSSIIPLDIQDGANAKLFLALGEKDPDYVEWKDYMTGTWFSSVTETTNYNPKVIRYSTTIEETEGHIYAPDNIWTMRGIPYFIGSDIKGIRLHGNRKVTGHDDSVVEIMSSFSTATINIKNGYYKKLYLAGLNSLGNTTDPDADVSYVLIYKDGTTTEGVLNINFSPEITGYIPSGGYIGRSGLDPEDSTLSKVKAGNYVIEVDSSKLIEKITFSCNEGGRIVYFLGIAGETATLGSLKQEIEEKISLISSGSGNSITEAVLVLEDLINEYKNAGGNIHNIADIEVFEEKLDEYYQYNIELVSDNLLLDDATLCYTIEYTKNIDTSNANILVLKDNVPISTDLFTITEKGNILEINVTLDRKTTSDYTIKVSGVSNSENPVFYAPECENTINIEMNHNVYDDRIFWKLDDEGTLTISGSGDMDWEDKAAVVPWDTLRSKIKKVIIEEGITSVGYAAFYNCIDLNEVKLANSITKFMPFAFNNTGLTHITLPDNLEDFTFNVLLYSPIEKIEISDNNKNFYVDEKGVLYDKAQKILMVAPYTSQLGAYIVPETVEEIRTCAFYKCEGITEVVLPDNVKSIGGGAFERCSNLTKCILPKDLEIIPAGLFYYCTNLQEIKVPETVRKISNYVFYECSSLKEIELPDTVEEIGEYAFRECASLESVNIPSKVKNLPLCVFYNCISLKEIEIPESVEEIGEYALRGCTNLTKITVPDSVKTLGKYAFAVCDNLTECILPKDLTVIPNGLFSSCINLQKIELPDTVVEIGEYAFYKCNKLESLNLPMNLKTIYRSTFYDCVSLKEIHIPDSVEEIAPYAFRGCSGLKEIRVPDSVKTLGDYAFAACENLEYIKLPEAILTIPVGLLTNCQKLKYVSIPDTVVAIGNYAFNNCYNMTVFYEGSVDTWENIIISSTGNSALQNVVINYLSQMFSVSVPHINTDAYVMFLSESGKTLKVNKFHLTENNSVLPAPLDTKNYKLLYWESLSTLKPINFE